MKIIKWILLIILLVMGLVFMLFAVFYYPQSPRQRAEFWFLLQGRYAQGSTQEQWLFAQALRADPTFAKAWMEKSVSYNKRGYYAEGFAALNKAVELEPVQYLGYRGYQRMAMLHDYDGAIIDLLRLDSLTPGVRDAPWGEDIYYVLGLAYKGKEDFLKAKAYFDQSIELTTQESGEKWVDVKLFLYLGITQAKLGNQVAALADFDKAISYYIQFTEAYYQKGLLLAKSGAQKEACKCFSASLKYFQEGYYYTDSYVELPDQIYQSDIEEALQVYCVNN